MAVDLVVAMEEGAQVVTATRRLARRLRLNFAKRQRDKGQAVWNTPDVVPWREWLSRLWGEIAETHPNGERQRLLNAAQERALWEDVVHRATADHPLLRSGEAAASAQIAWERLKAWQIPLSALDSRSTPETIIFRDWLTSYRHRCREGGWIDTPLLAEHCAVNLLRFEKSFSTSLCFAGFDEFTPQQESFLQRLTEAGCVVDRWMPTVVGTSSVRREFPRVEEELTAAARWARELLTREPEASVGIVVPDLPALRTRVQRIFDDIVAPGSVLPGEGISRVAYGLSLGCGLMEYPIVVAATVVLELAAGEISYDRLSYLLRSPFVGGTPREASARALVDAHFRRAGELVWGLPEINALFAQLADGRWQDLRITELMSRFTETQRNLPKHALPSRWSAHYQALLRAAGWPGERPLDSREHQTVQRFNEALAQFASLDGVLAEQNYSQALTLLKRILGETIFQPEGEDMPLLVLGALEAAGLTFDHLWVTGLHDRAWPPPPRPNPFLPLQIQRRYGLPHSSADRERSVAARTLERLVNSSVSFVASWPSREGDETLRPSPLIKAFAAPEAPVGTEPRLYREAIFETRALEELANDTAPSVEGTTSGGSGILKEQAACPFRAFALFRIGSQPLARPTLGLDPATRGRLVHDVFESLWEDLKSHEKLTAIGDAELRGRLELAIRRAMARLPRRRGNAWRTILRIEQARLVRLFSVLLLKERDRAPFTVEACEVSRSSTVGRLRLNTRIDRIDRLDNGGRVIMDYKSGGSDIRGWFGKRPDEPQVPLYAVTDPGRLEAVVLTSVAAGAVEFKGISRRDGQFPGVPAYERSRLRAVHGDWERLLATWRDHLGELADQFADGDARVEPKSGQTCKVCHLGALCRIDEIRGSLVLDDD